MAFWLDTVKALNSYSSLVSSLTTEFYDPKTFFTHAALLRQTCVRAEDSLLLPPVGVWAVSQSQCDDHPLRSAIHHGLGEPLPHQLANAPWSIHQQKLASFLFKPCGSKTYAVLASVSECYPLMGGLPRVTHPFATR